MGHNLSVPGKDEAGILEDYFAWNYGFRTGNHSVRDAVLVLNSGPGYNDQEMNYTGIFSDVLKAENVTKDAYLGYLQASSGSKLLYLTAHSWPKGHVLYDQTLTASEMNDLYKNSVFYLLNACSACRWDEFVSTPNDPNYMGGLYVFSKMHQDGDFGLGAACFTGVGGFNNLAFFTDYYHNSQQGATYGDMLVYWFNRNLQINFGSTNYVFLGDLTIGPDSGMGCPPDLVVFDPEVDGCTVTINGVVTSPCNDPVQRINWDWGDGTSNDSWFPATHVYSQSSTYVVTVTAYTAAGYTATETKTVTVSCGPPPTVSIAIEPSPKTASVGDIFTLDIKVSASSQPVDSVDSYLSFDRNYLRVVDASGNETSSIIPGSALPVILQNSADNSHGRITYSAGKQLGGVSPSDDFVLATIRFRAIAVTGIGGTNVSFLSGTDVFYQGNSVLGSTSDGNVQITEAVLLKGHVALQGRGSPPNDRWNNFPLAITLYSPGGTNPIGNYTANTDASGYFTVTGISQGTYDVKVKNVHTLSNKKASVTVPTGPTAVDFGTLWEGDANNDDNISGADYSILATAYAKCSGQSGWDARADFNGSGCIEGADYSLLASNYGRHGPIPLGIPGVSPKESPVEAHATSGSVVVSIDPSSKSVTPGTIFTLDIKIAAGSQPVDSVDTYLSFDRNYLRVVDTSGNETNSVMPGTTLPVVLQNSADNSHGRIAYSAGRQLGGTPPSGDFALATIRFKAIAATLGQGTSIAFQSGTDVFYEGESVLGSTENGNVIVGNGLSHKIYLSLILKN
jgi:hypothetical protein